MNDVLDAIGRLVAEERLGAVATVISGPDLGARAVIDADEGIVAGALPDEVVADALADADALMARERSATLAYGDREIFVETVAPPPRLVVVGAVHIAQPLASMAKMLGFHVTVTDARPAFTTPERFPDADEILVGWPADVADRLVLDRRTYVVILTHDARYERPILPMVLDAPVRYIGAMGSRRTHAKRVAWLREQGYDDAAIARIHGPVGLDIGAETAEETAISILAEMIQVRYGSGTGLSLRGREGRIHRQRPEEG